MNSLRRLCPASLSDPSAPRGKASTLKGERLRERAPSPSRSRFLATALTALLPALLSCGPATEEGPPPQSADSNPSTVAFRIPERDLFPEGIAYDPVSGDFFLGSLRKSKILRLSGEGGVDTLADRRVLGMGGILGMKVDPERRVLWANFHQAREQLESDSTLPFRTGIHAIDLNSGRLLRSYSIRKEEENHLLNDIALASDGTVYLTSYSKGTLYRILPGGEELEEWLPMPEGVYTNGIDLEPGERFLFVVGNADIYRVEIETREVIRLGVPEGEFIGYGDGLYYHDGSLVVIASYMEEEALHYRILRLDLSEDLSTVNAVQVLDRDHPLYAFPTTGAMVEGWLYYIATAQFDKIDEEGTVAPWEELSDVYVLKVEVSG